MPADHSRRRVLQLSGLTLATSLGGCATLVDRGRTPAEQPMGDSPTTVPTTEIETTTTTGTETTREPTTTVSVEIDRPTVSFADRAPIPDDPGDHRYATMGRSDASATATVFGNWKCPHTRAFVLEQLDDVVAEFVEVGSLAIQFRFVAYRSGEPFLGPDAPRATRAGLSVWHADPETYPSYLAYVFTNQPSERSEWAQPDLLLEFAEAAGVENRPQVERDIAGDAHASATMANTEAARSRGIHSVPRVVAGGEVTAPTIDPEETIAQLERATDA